MTRSRSRPGLADTSATADPNGRGAINGVREREASCPRRGDRRRTQPGHRTRVSPVALLREPHRRRTRCPSLTQQRERRHRAGSSTTLADHLVGQWSPPRKRPSPRPATPGAANERRVLQCEREHDDGDADRFGHADRLFGWVERVPCLRPPSARWSESAWPRHRSPRSRV